MIYFIYGNDSYRLQKTYQAIKEKYAGNSDMNFSLFEDSFDLEKIRFDVISLPFLAKKRLVVIKNILGAKGVDMAKMTEILNQKADSTVILFLEEGQPDKRTSLYKRLVKEKSKELNILSGPKLTKWIKTEIERSGGEVGIKETNMLAAYFGGDLWQLKNEIQKLLSYGKKITEENIEKLSVSNLNVKIFDLTDAITAGNRQKAFKVLKDLIDSGENELYILSMIEWQMRNVAQIYDLKNMSEKEIALKLKMNPFVVKKNLFGVKKISDDSTIRNYYNQILSTENDIKTGAKEPQVALELLINKLTG